MTENESKIGLVEQSHRWGEITNDYAELITEVWIGSPIPIPPETNPISIDYTVKVNNRDIADAEMTDINTGYGGTTFEIHCGIPHHEITNWWPAHIENKEETRITIHPEIHLENSLLGIHIPTPLQTTHIRTQIENELSSQKQDVKKIRGRKVMEINEIQYRWSDVKENHTEADITIELRNPTRLKIPLNNLYFEIKNNDVKIGEGETQGIKGVPSKESITLDGKIKISHSDLSTWWHTHIENNEETEVNVNVYAEFLGLKYPRPIYTQTSNFETDILQF